jgi:cation diffusion facilitator family transporter
MIVGSATSPATSRSPGWSTPSSSRTAAVAAAGVIGFAGNEGRAVPIRVGCQIGSAALVADGYHARTDGLTSLAVVAGALGVALGYPAADPLIGLLITVAILVVLRQATAQMLGRLMDAVEPELVDEVERTARAVPEVQDVSRVRVRWVGHALEASFAITVDCDMTVGEGHRRRGRPPPAAARGGPARHGRDPREPVRPRRAGPHAELRHHDVPAQPAR